jgi:glycosyltransferase involved in cell wall biosynthesis
VSGTERTTRTVAPATDGPPEPVAPRRIMLFVHALNGRGIAQVAGCVAEETARRGHEVVVVAGSTSGERSPLRDVEVIDLGADASRTWRTIPALRSTIRELRPDALYAHGNGPARAAVLATRGLRARPFLVTVEHNHYSSYAWRWRRARDVLNRALLPRADRVAGVAPEIVEDLEALFPGVRGRTAMVPPPLTRWDQLATLAEAPVAHPWFADEDVPVVVSVANIHPRKDPETLVRALADVNGRSSTPVRLALIGRPSDPVLQRRLAAVAAEAGIGQHVAFLGFQDNPLAFVARATAFVLTSRNEGLPISLLEAMALGVPIVSTDCLSGPSYLLEGGAYGELAPVGDARGVADAILRVLEDPARRRQLQEDGPRRVARFTPARVADDYLRLLAPLESSRVPPPQRT